MIQAPTDEQIATAKRGIAVKELRYGKSNPLVTDVELEISSVHNKRMAPAGHVWFITRLTWDATPGGQRKTEMKYTRGVMVKRSGMPAEAEEQIKHKAKVDFLTLVIRQLDKPVTMRDRIKQMQQKQTT